MQSVKYAGKENSFINHLPSYSFSLLMCCIWWSVGLRPIMRIACLSCFVDMQPFLFCPKNSKTSMYSKLINIHSFIHSLILPLTRNTTYNSIQKYIKDNIRTIFQLNYYKIKYGKGKEAYIEAGGL